MPASASLRRHPLRELVGRGHADHGGDAVAGLRNQRQQRGRVGATLNALGEFFAERADQRQQLARRVACGAAWRR